MSRCPCEKLKGDLRDWSDTCVGQLWLFEGLAPEELAAVAAKAVRSIHPAGSAVFLQGEQARSVFLIKSGRIKLSRLMESGAEIMMDIRESGECLGEHLLGDPEAGYVYPVSAWCQTKVVVCGFTRRAFEELVLEHPRIGLRVIKTMGDRITSLTERLEAMSQVRLEERIHAVLLSVAREHGRESSEGAYALDFPLTHEDLGFLVGAHRVSVTRIMKKLRAAGRIDHDGKLLVVRDLASGARAPH
jgi:CRP/FNR family transcriptional regulator